MTKLGFTHYDEVEPDVQPTIPELIAALNNEQKAAILDGFIKEIHPARLREKYRDLNIPKRVIARLYEIISKVRDRSQVLMRGEVLITGPVFGENGEITTPAVYNTSPNTASKLIDIITDDFSDDLSSDQVVTILTLMVEWSKSDGTGTWTFYKTEVSK